MLPFPLKDQSDIIKLRQTLHQNPELSGQEYLTAERIVNFLNRYKPDAIITELGGNGVAAIFNGEKVGPVILFRAELDALPITETSVLPYTSTIEGISHKCGHDGHMSILIGLASLLHEKRPLSGKVIILFQPAEETGKGAWDVLNHKSFEKLKPDYVFALHNLPGIPLHKIIVRNNTFAAASTGIIIELFGKTSHAAEPENGLNPGEAMAEIILSLQRIARKKDEFKELTLLTIIHASLGEIAFGTNPGYATVMATLRSFSQEDLEHLKKLAISVSDEICSKHGLEHHVRFVEEFPATVNNHEAVDVIVRAANSLELEVEHAVNPFKWSEDFGHFTRLYKGALFGIGAGINHAQLHHSDYDFPDELLPTGSRLFYAISNEILNI